MTKFVNMVRAFARDEDGIALTEYLILLGILSAAVIAAVSAVGADLGTAWGTWQTWFGSAALNAPTTP